MRFVDWNIFSRLNRPYVKQFHHEEEMHVVVLRGHRLRDLYPE